MEFVNAFIGAAFRRYFGGWLPWPGDTGFFTKSKLKKVLGFVLGFYVAYGATQNLTASLLMALYLGLGVIGPDHTYGTWLMDGNDRYGRPHKLWTDILALGASYLIITFTVGLVWYLVTQDVNGLWYMPRGAIIPLWYLAGKYLFEKTGWNEDHPLFNRAAIGEFGVGAVLFGI